MEWARKPMNYKDEIERIIINEEFLKKLKDKFMRNFKKILDCLKQRLQALEKGETKPMKKPRKIKDPNKERILNLLKMGNELFNHDVKKASIKQINDIVDSEELKKTIEDFEKKEKDVEIMDPTNFHKFYTKFQTKAKLINLISYQPKLFKKTDEDSTVCQTKDHRKEEEGGEEKERDLFDFNIDDCQEEEKEMLQKASLQLTNQNIRYLGVRLENPPNGNLCFLNAFVHVVYKMITIRNFILNKHYANIFLQELKSQIENYHHQEVKKNKYDVTNLTKLRRHLIHLGINDNQTKNMQQDPLEVFTQFMHFLTKKDIVIDSSSCELEKVSESVNCENFLIESKCVSCLETISITPNPHAIFLSKSIDSSFCDNKSFFDYENITEIPNHLGCNEKKSIEYLNAPEHLLLPEVIWVKIDSSFALTNQNEFIKKSKEFIRNMPALINQDFFNNSNRLQPFEYYLKSLICSYSAGFSNKIGGSSHYVTYIERNVDEWVCCDDETHIFLGKFEEVIKHCSKNEYHAHVLIYEKIQQNKKKNRAIVSKAFS